MEGLDTRMSDITAGLAKTYSTHPTKNVDKKLHGGCGGRKDQGGDDFVMSQNTTELYINGDETENRSLYSFYHQLFCLDRYLIWFFSFRRQHWCTLHMGSVAWMTMKKYIQFLYL